MNMQERIHYFKTNYANVIPSSFIEWLVNSGYFTAPASTKYHGAYQGGLFDHCINMTNTLVEYTWKLELNWQREESPFIIGLFHDLCKIDEYEETDIGYRHKADNTLSILGHGDKSILLLSQHFTLTEEEIFCIRYHMGAYQTSEWAQFDQAIKKYPNVLFTHTADMYASKILDKEGQIITIKELVEEFYASKNDNYQMFRQSYLDDGYQIIETDND